MISLRIVFLKLTSVSFRRVRFVTVASGRATTAAATAATAVTIGTLSFLGVNFLWFTYDAVRKILNGEYQGILRI